MNVHTADVLTAEDPGGFNQTVQVIRQRIFQDDVADDLQAVTVSQLAQ